MVIMFLKFFKTANWKFIREIAEVVSKIFHPENKSCGVFRIVFCNKFMKGHKGLYCPVLPNYLYIPLFHWAISFSSCSVVMPGSSSFSISSINESISASVAGRPGRIQSSAVKGSLSSSIEISFTYPKVRRNETSILAFGKLLSVILIVVITRNLLTKIRNFSLVVS